MKAAGLIAAAGLSERMGAFKPLLPIGGKPMIEHTVQTFFDAGIEDVWVVVGKNGDALVRALSHLPVRFVPNCAYATSDMLLSIQIGLADLASVSDAEAVFLLPADMPMVPYTLLPRLIRRMEQTGASLVFPSRDMRRLHPPLLHRSCFATVEGYAGEGGLRGAFASLAGRIAYVLTDDEGCEIDVDTPADYQRMLLHRRDACVAQH
ncbi:MAG: nucleotidyltransferase family protein [bacterium]|nr:nucleotidyltransferase family protein [bacterium]